MAVVWANTDGTWSTDSMWNYWDGTAEVAYGKIPQPGDTVYCNGHVISLPATYSINLGIGKITNETNPYTNISGGYIQTSTGNTTVTFIVSEIIAKDTYVLSNRGSGAGAGAATIFIIGDCYNDGAGSFVNQAGTSNMKYALDIVGDYTGNSGVIYDGRYNSSSDGYLSITGNIELTGTARIRTTQCKRMVFTGNITSTSSNPIFSANIDSFTLVGNINVSNANMNTGTITVANITGNIDLGVNSVVNIDTLNLDGNITYQGRGIGCYAATLNIINPDTFTWHDISTTRVNPFIIVTDADMNNHQQYPLEEEVKEGTEYVWGERVGTYAPDYPPESVVLKGYRYDNNTKEGTLENQNVVGCVTPEDVRKDVPLVGMGVVGSLVVPSVDDVREGVVFDNGSVGTLVVQGGGERLRIADFSYYTNAQSDTYIVDITDADKPKFASAEERVLIEMFPDLDLENIPDKYFDALFVKYLKYRLLVEYYRTAGINSTFTPGEVTTEIVNYQNVRNEVWLNSANTYLKAWGEKYPNSIKKQRIML